MGTCIDKILCQATSKCDIIITDENGNEINTRFLHEGDTIYLHVALNVEDKEFQGFLFQPIDGVAEEIEVTEVGEGVYMDTARCGGTYIANYCKDRFTVEVRPDDDSHGTAGPSWGRYGLGEQILLVATENNGYTFEGWYIDDVLISNQISYLYIVDGDALIIARYKTQSFTIITLSNQPDLGSANGGGTYQYGDTVTISATPNTSCDSFLNWDDNNNNPQRTITVTGDATYKANFEKYKYTLTIELCYIGSREGIDENNAGVVYGAGVYNCGTSVSLNAVASIGCNVGYWSVNGTTVQNGGDNYTFTITSNTNIIVCFDDINYTLSLSVSPNGSGIITNGTTPYFFSGGNNYKYGDMVTAQAVNVGNWEFNRWDDNTTQAGRVFVMTQNITAIAYFTENIPQQTLKIYIDPDINAGEVKIYNGNTLISGQAFYDSTLSKYYYSATVLQGTILTAEAYGKNGFQFTNWQNAPTQYFQKTYTMTSDITDTAYFSVIPNYTLTLCDTDIDTILTNGYGFFIISYNNQQIQVVSPSDAHSVTVPSGTSITVTYQANSGYTNYEIPAQNWDTTNINNPSSNYTCNNNSFVITLTNNGLLCATTEKVGAKIIVQNNPSNVLAGNMLFTIVYNNTSTTQVPQNNSLTSNHALTTPPSTYTVTVTEQNPIQGYIFEKLEIIDGSATNQYSSMSAGGTLYNDQIITCYYIQDVPTVTLTIYYDDGEGYVEIVNNATNPPTIFSQYDQNNRCVHATVPQGGSLTVSVRENSGYTLESWDNNIQNRYYTRTFNNLQVDESHTIEFCGGVTFTFDIDDVSTVNINNQQIQNGNGTGTNTGTVAEAATGDTFSVITNWGYTFVDVFDKTDGEIIGDGCNYCYNSFPFVDKYNNFYYYHEINSQTVQSLGITPVIIYDCSYILGPNSPTYVELVDVNNTHIAYAELVKGDMANNTVTYPSTGQTVQMIYLTIWNDIIASSGFYNLVSSPSTPYDGGLYVNSMIQINLNELTPLITNCGDQSPLFLAVKGINAFYVRMKTNCTYSVECGHEYHICLLDGNFVKSQNIWSPISALPSPLPPGTTLAPVPQGYTGNMTQFIYDFDPNDPASGDYAEVPFNGETVYLENISNC